MDSYVLFSFLIHLNYQQNQQEIMNLQWFVYFNIFCDLHYQCYFDYFSWFNKSSTYLIRIRHENDYIFNSIFLIFDIFLFCLFRPYLSLLTVANEQKKIRKKLSECIYCYNLKAHIDTWLSRYAINFL